MAILNPNEKFRMRKEEPGIPKPEFAFWICQ